MNHVKLLHGQISHRFKERFVLPKRRWQLKFIFILNALFVQLVQILDLSYFLQLKLVYLIVLDL